ncbi:hypothetical protein F5Y06DRAFT_307335 [Hypoxylon sp. FL0890]|nr:hypothetical protein F5Y06DRAFT_307335 [Hypoxylon sp. FL0890]
MADKASPVTDLTNDIVSALRSFTGSSVNFKVTTRNEEAGEIPYEVFLAKVDPKEVIPRDTKEWEEFQWKTRLLVIYVDCSKVEQHQIVNRSDKSSSITEVLEKVIEEHIKVYDNGNETYPVNYGTDPRLFLVVLQPFNINIGPKSAQVSLPPTVSAKYKSKFGLSDEQMAGMRHTIDLDDENDSSRVEWEKEWTDWRARTAHGSTSSPRNPFSKAMKNLKKHMHKDK